MFSLGPNRYVCSVLDEMRKTLEVHEKLLKMDGHTTRYIILQSSLIEEAQTMVNRMECALEDHKDIKRLHQDRSDLNKEVAKLEEKKRKLKVDISEMEDD